MQSVTFEKDELKAFFDGQTTKTNFQGKKFICIKRKVDDISQRGIMVKNKADSLTSSDGKLSTQTSWGKINGTLFSIPYAAPLQLEQWFTSQHTHDRGANNDVAVHPIMALPSSLREMFGYSDEEIFNGTYRNSLVNIDRVTAKDRGINFIIIDTSKLSKEAG